MHSDSSTVDEVDLSLVHAIERSPRASWTELSAVLGLDPATVARRWDRLRREGLAWVTCYPLLTGDSASAIIELDCESGQAIGVAQRVAQDPRALFVDVVTGTSDVMLTADCAGRAALSRYVLDELPALPGVRSVRTQPIVNVHFEGGYAAGGTLQPAALTRLPSPEHGLLLTSPEPVDDLDEAICAVLSADGRRPLSELAREVGSGETTVRRRLHRLAAQGLLRFMVELAASAAGTATTVWLNARVPSARREAAIYATARVSQVKAVVSVAGADNIVLKAGLRQLAALDEFETRLSERAPELEITNRKIVLQPIRLMSRLVDTQGRATAVIPTSGR